LRGASGQLGVFVRRLGPALRVALAVSVVILGGLAWSVEARATTMIDGGPVGGQVWTAAGSPYGGATGGTAAGGSGGATGGRGPIGDAAKAGGCHCDMTGGHAPGATVVLLAAAIAIATRRSRRGAPLAEKSRSRTRMRGYHRRW
jgi:hypothetical protein